MYAEQMGEYTHSADIYTNPQHPYTKGLLKSIPNIELEEQKLQAITGSPPDQLNLPKGCRFWPRCEHVTERCKMEEPALIKTGTDHFVRCFQYRGEKRD